MAEFEFSSKEFKTLSSQTRVDILKILRERKYTLSELSRKLRMSSPSVKEHMDLLRKNGFVEKVDEGRKWKYYALSRKSAVIVGAREGNMLIVLAMAGAAFFAVFYTFIGRFAVFLNQMPVAAESAPVLTSGASGAAESAAGIAAENIADKAASAAAGVLQNVLPAEIYIYIAALVVLGIVLGYALARSFRGNKGVG